MRPRAPPARRSCRRRRAANTRSGRADARRMGCSSGLRTMARAPDRLLADRARTGRSWLYATQKEAPRMRGLVSADRLEVWKRRVRPLNLPVVGEAAPDGGH